MKDGKCCRTEEPDLFRHGKKSPFGVQDPRYRRRGGRLKYCGGDECLQQTAGRRRAVGDCLSKSGLSGAFRAAPGSQGFLAS